MFASFRIIITHSAFIMKLAGMTISNVYFVYVSYPLLDGISNYLSPMADLKKREYFNRNGNFYPYNHHEL